MNIKQICILPLLSLAACVSTSLPKGYSGPTANLKDSAQTHSNSKADLFCVTKIDDRNIADSLTATLVGKQGMGFILIPSILERPLPAQPITLELKARTVYAAPIQEMFGKVYTVSGTIPFRPKPNGAYIVKGKLGPEEQSIWIEDAETGSVVSEKISK